MRRKQIWLALAVVFLGGIGNRAHAQYAYYPFPSPGPANGPMVQFVDNHQQPDGCRSGIMGGAAAYFLRPHINDNVALTTTANTGTAIASQVSDQFDWNYHVAPAVWLGWTSSCGVGFRARAFHFDQSSEPISATVTREAATVVTVTPPSALAPLGAPPRGFQSPGIILTSDLGEDLLTFQSDLRIWTVDAEATFTHEWCHCGLLLTVGGRYCEIEQNYHASLVNIPAAGTFERSFLDSNRDFSGAGPTMSVMARWQIGRSGLSVYGTARGSILVGASRSRSSFLEIVEDPTIVAGGSQTRFIPSESTEHIVLPIGELEGGLEYSRACGRTRFFVRGGAVNHTYFEAGSASSKDGAVTLFGGQVAVGLNY